MTNQQDEPVQEGARAMRGIILRSTGSWYQVSEWNSRAVYGCRAGGRMRLNGERSTNPLAVGDIVQFESNGQTEAGLITEREERKNAIVRRSVNLSKESHVVAANLDRAFLVATISQPSTSTGFIDRFLVTAEAYGIPTTLVFNKCDLVAASERDEEALSYMSELYEMAGYDVLRVSAQTGEGLTELRAAIAASGVNMLSGHSGVGKTTLINQLLPGLELRTGDVSDSHQKGKHTTTYAEMFPLPSGGYLIDTPGIKGFGLVQLEKEHLHHYFPEIFALLSSCKFHNCLHRAEPKCAVRSAVEQGVIAEERYLNYLDLYENFDADNQYR
jgi:ribosome biogenesis GTPase